MCFFIQFLREFAILPGCKKAEIMVYCQQNAARLILLQEEFLVRQKGGAFAGQDFDVDIFWYMQSQRQRTTHTAWLILLQKAITGAENGRQVRFRRRVEWDISWI